ncbi:prospero homeobox protein 2 [Colossoma macropomum]|uniref:prospero homeobox protein 2 n=1 Tax=Colossoma macropomum TaxID=42526 RepID=UPI001865524D|nr:prospero homeobox protein 2 [Colossoma macropomum]
MNLTPPDQSIHKPNDGCLEDSKADLMLPCFRRGMYEEPLSSYHSGSLISHLLRKTIHSKRPALNSGHLYLPPSSVSGAGLVDSGSTLAESAQEDRSSMSSKDSLGESSSPGGHPSGMSAEPERPLSEHLQAKRARVENIIRGMAGSPSDRSHGEGDGVEGEAGRYGTEVYKESKRKRKLPQHQEHSHSTTLTMTSSANTSKDEECHKLREQLQSMQRLLRQLQEKFLQMYDHGNSENEEKGEGDFQEDISEAQLDLSIDSDNKRIGNKERMKADGSYLSSERDQKSLQEMLKCELSRAVSESVDMVFRKLSMTLSPQPQVCQSPEYTNVEKRAQQACAPELSDSEDVSKSRPLEFYESTPAPSPEHQTEALSLVVRKPTLNQLSSVSQQVKRPYPLHQAPFQFSYSAPLHDSQILEHLLKYGPHANFGGIPCLPPSLDRSSPDSMDLPWESIAMRSKVSSGHLGQHHRPGALGQVTVDSLCLPHVKMECGDLQSMAERSTFMSLNIQEGLTPNHLKKAKLMFFYTRYPSSNVLKTFFPDVKFNRCITSQLIKWFSNFREFYYIQMEKFARQAIVDGVSDVKDLAVTRDSELFRALNMHYNKANDFQVPDRFLEVAEITLHEFYNAISLNKDTDPSWKKAIYKVICKLDSDVPEEFKSPSYLYA